mgnify:CR=1 FL=1
MILAPGAFRLLLALAVMASHVSRWEVGRLAVLLFFFLSGYWVTRIWSSKFSMNRLGAFYGARYFRIAPMYLLVMSVTAALTGAPILLHNLTLLGVASVGKDPTGVSWSLDIELQFYLLVPFLVTLVATSPRTAVALCAAVPLLGWFVLHPMGLVTLAQYLPAFMLGMFTSTQKYAPGRRMALTSLAAFGTATIALMLFPATFKLLDKLQPNFIDQDIFAFLWMLPLLPYVAHSLTLKSSSLDRHFGNLSYPLYLVHFPIILWAVEHFGEGPISKLLACGLSCIVALILYVLFDRPVDAIRLRIFESSTPSSQKSHSKSASP